MKYVIAWKSCTTEASHRGTLGFDREVALELVEKLNREHPDLFHWIEPVS